MIKKNQNKKRNVAPKINDKKISKYLFCGIMILLIAVETIVVVII